MKIFISHKSDDKMHANEIHKALSGIDGVDVWVDAFNLAPGDDLKTTISSAIEDTDAVVVIWSDATDASEWVRREMETGTKSEKRLIPCILDRSLPRTSPFLQGKLYLDFDDAIIGFGHFCLAHIVPSALEEADWDPQEPDIVRYQGIVSHCIRDLIGLGKKPEEAEYWKSELEEGLENAIDYINWVQKKERKRSTIFQILDAVRNPILDMHERIEELLDDIIADPHDVETARIDEMGGSIEENFDDLDQYVRIVMADFDEETLETVVESLMHYITSAPATFDALSEFADAVEDETLNDILHSVRLYIEDLDDLLPESELGFIGFLDDAWVVNNVAFRLHEADLMLADDLPVDLDDIISGDLFTRYVVPEEVLDALEQFMVQIAGALCEAFPAYEPSHVIDEDGRTRFFMSRV